MSGICILLLFILISDYYCVIYGAYLRNSTRSLGISPEAAAILTKPIARKGIQLEKNAFNNRTRLVFFAGLEGTGHHAIHSMIQVCVAEGKCEAEQTIGGAAMRYNTKANVIYGAYGTGSVENVMYEVAIIENRMREMLKIAKEQMFYIGLNSHTGAGMMSYPNYETRDKALDNPDVYSLAMIAESVGIDFRVIVLQRRAESVLKSAVGRGFGGIGIGNQLEPLILISSAQTLYAQLSLLDKKFIECVEYSELSTLSEEKKARLIDFMHPTNMKDVFPAMLKRVVPHEHRNLLAMESMNVKYHGMILSHVLGLIDSLCDKRE